MEKVIKIKNISRKPFTLDLSAVTDKKVLKIKPNTVVPITLDEYTYLSTQCRGAFIKGFLEVEKISEELKVDKIESDNVMSEADIDALMDLTNAKLKGKIANVTAIHLLKDIRTKAVEVGKTDKFIEVIDEKISELAGGSILL